MKAECGMFTCVKKFSKPIAVLLICIAIAVCFIYAKRTYSNADFGETFGAKATTAAAKLQAMDEGFTLCAAMCNTPKKMMKAIVFPEVMRYSTIKDGIEAESLRTLYVQFGKEYANFSIGLFQMKPSFAEQVELKSKQLLADSTYKELQLTYTVSDEEDIRRQRVQRLLDKDWQLVYLTAFVCICNQIYQHKQFSNTSEKLQWYATVYNAGFEKDDAYISKKISQGNFYLNQQMPGKKFKYAAIASWFYNKP